MTDKEASRGAAGNAGFVDSRVFNGNTNRNTFVPVPLYLFYSPSVHTPRPYRTRYTNNPSVCRGSPDRRRAKGYYLRFSRNINCCGFYRRDDVTLSNHRYHNLSLL